MPRATYPVSQRCNDCGPTPACVHQFLAILAGRESRVAETSADGQCAPMLNVGHKWRLAEPLHHGIVMHHDGGIFVIDLRDGFVQRCRQMEVARLPVARQVLRAPLDRAVLVDDTRAANSDERRQR